MRVRIVADGSGQRSAVLTLKGRRQGICRKEYERPLGINHAEQILGALPATRIICKARYLLRYCDGLVWSIDLFEGPNTGLVIAEVELADPKQHVELPLWVGEEITFNSRYGNSALARSPIRDCRDAVRRSDASLPGDSSPRVAPTGSIPLLSAVDLGGDRAIDQKENGHDGGILIHLRLVRRDRLEGSD